MTYDIANLLCLAAAVFVILSLENKATRLKKENICLRCRLERAERKEP